MNVVVNGQKAPLAAFLAANRGNLTPAQVKALKSLRAGQSVVIMGTRITRAKCGACEGRK